MSKRTAIRNLSCAAIEVKPVNADWTKGYGETWEYTEASHCSECNAVVIGREGDRHRDVDSDSTCLGSLSGEGPMMSYWYPVEIDDKEEAARALVDLPVCVVEVDGQTGLALTGGGMDLSWDICEAFVVLGYLPPLHFCDLPGMAGKNPDSARNRRTVAACLKSCVVAASWAKSRAARLRSTIESMRKRTRNDDRKEARP
jgi:hypothetical protein